MKIYTKTGDTGDTSLFAGGRVRKNNPLVEAYGTVDELNSFIGLVRTETLPEQADTWLEQIQNELFIVGADLATPLDAKPEWLVRLDAAPTDRLEAAIDQMDAELPTLKNFVLPGGTRAAATLHVARTVCRRGERVCVEILTDDPINPQIVKYLNRLSDFLFTLARWVNFKAGESEIKWTAGRIS
ncbi:MAG: cob(I)yrinic acid a,c-diamide adenosyltransferase [Chloroflexota bacterium]|nr:cob(I)yrinic acid a,c-diamide adenosyltransferase [Chloroflexota bacterium]